MDRVLNGRLPHLVFATKNREPWLDGKIRSPAFAYLAEVGRDLGCVVYRVGGMADHVHIAVQLTRKLSVADSSRR
nr:transposase [Phragmitibacter flavus]